MGFRVECVDAESGRAMPAYETRAASEDEVRDEAGRLGVRILRLTPRDTPALPERPDFAHADSWSGRVLRWRVTPAMLVQLGLEHPRWGARLYAALAGSVALLKWKALFNVLVASGIGLLAAIGLDLREGATHAMAAFILLAVPVALIKLYALARLRRLHAPDGFPTLHTLCLDGADLLHDSGGIERRLPLGQVREVHDLPNFLLVTLRNGSEVAVPRRALATRSQAQGFAAVLGQPTGAPVHREFRSRWLGREPLIRTHPRFARAMLGLALVVGVGTIAWIFLAR